jgi:hypothetical protein
VNDFGHGRVDRYAREGIACVHLIFYAEKFRSKAACWMKLGKVFGLKSAALKQRNG